MKNGYNSRTKQDGQLLQVRNELISAAKLAGRGDPIVPQSPAVGILEYSYQYDDVGNRITSTDLGTNTTYAANCLNQYTNIVRGGVAEHPAFDADGNQTDIVTGTGRWLVEYNGENRPVRWTRPPDGTILEMSYDSRGRRVRSNADTFVYDDYLNVGTTVWDPTEPVATRPLVWLAGDGPAYYFHDGNKNVSDVVSAAAFARYSYAPFGQSAAEGALVGANPYRFSSEARDDMLDLTYYNYRQYDLRAGRWINRDHLGELEILNLYGFAVNSPLVWLDFLGESIDADVCRSAVGNALSTNAKGQSLVRALGEKSCPVPPVTCECCMRNESGAFNPSTKSIKICVNILGSARDVIETVVHELVHAFDDCSGTDWNDCEQRACSEIRAVNYNGSCRVGGMLREPGKTYRECVRDAAASSTAADRTCGNGYPAVNSVFSRCFGGGVP